MDFKTGDFGFLQLFADGASSDGLGEGSRGGGDTVGNNCADDGRDAEFSRLIKGEYKDAYTKRTQNIINRRFREMKELEAYRDGTRDIIDGLCSRYGVERGDISALRAAAFGGEVSQSEARGGEDGFSTNGESMFADASDGAGNVPVDASSASAEKVRARLSEDRRRAAAEGVYEGWMKEAEELREDYPDFNLAAECGSAAFVSMLTAGVPVRDAFEAVHHREILSGAMGYAAKSVYDSVWKSILSGGARPAENGLSAKSSPMERRSISGLSDREIKNILKRVEKGEKVVF